jgi:hypothetical protein
MAVSFTGQVVQLVHWMFDVALQGEEINWPGAQEVLQRLQVPLLRKNPDIQPVQILVVELDAQVEFVQLAGIVQSNTQISNFETIS